MIQGHNAQPFSKSKFRKEKAPPPLILIIMLKNIPHGLPDARKYNEWQILSAIISNAWSSPGTYMRLQQRCGRYIMQVPSRLYRIIFLLRLTSFIIGRIICRHTTSWRRGPTHVILTFFKTGAKAKCAHSCWQLKQYQYLPFDTGFILLFTYRH